MSLARFALFVIALGSAGCMSKRASVALRTGGDATPVVEVKPGYVERIALMDQYRLHDEMRKHMMARPRVWVEELSPDELPPANTDEESEPAEEQPTSAATAPAER